MSITNLPNLNQVNIQVPNPQLLQGWEPFDGAILYAERGKKYLIFSEAPEIRFPAPDSTNGEIQFLKISDGIATINPQTHTIEGGLAFDNRGIFRLISTDDRWIVAPIVSGSGGGNDGAVLAGGSARSRQIILTAATENFLYESGALTVGVQPLTVSIAGGADEQGKPINTIVEVLEEPLQFPNLPTGSTVYFWVDDLGNLGHTTTEPIEVDYLPGEKELLSSSSPVSLMDFDDGSALGFSAGSTTPDFYETRTKPWLAFDGNPSTFWGSSGVPNPVLRKNLLSPQEVTKYAITPSTVAEGWGAEYTPSAWTLEGWDGLNWVVVDSQSAQSFAQNQRKEYFVSSPRRFDSYQLVAVPSSAGAPYVAFSLDLYAVAPTSHFYLIPEGQTYQWNPSIQAFTKSPRIFVGEAETDQTKLLAVRPYQIGGRVFKRQIVYANTNTAISTNLGTERAIYSASIPLKAASGGVIGWNRNFVIVRSSVSGQVMLSGERNY